MSAELWNVAEIAAYARLSVRHVREVLVHRKGFPKPEVNAGPKSRLWCADAVRRALKAARQ